LVVCTVAMPGKKLVCTATDLVLLPAVSVRARL